MNKLATKERHHYWYWSSTETDDTDACSQYFFNGALNDVTKTYVIRTRPIRRVKK